MILQSYWIYFFECITTPVEFNLSWHLPEDMLKNLPGKNPGTSTNVMIGILNESQNLTNLAPFTEALISRQPEISQHTCIGTSNLRWSTCCFQDANSITAVLMSRKYYSETDRVRCDVETSVILFIRDVTINLTYCCNWNL